MLCYEQTSLFGFDYSLEAKNWKHQSTEFAAATTKRKLLGTNYMLNSNKE